MGIKVLLAYKNHRNQINENNNATDHKTMLLLLFIFTTGNLKQLDRLCKNVNGHLLRAMALNVELNETRTNNC